MSSPELLRAAEAGEAQAQYFYWSRQEKEANEEEGRLYDEIFALEHRLKGDEQQWAEARWGAGARVELGKVPQYGDSGAQISLDRQKVDQVIQRAVKAFEWLERSANQGLPLAEYDAAIRYLGESGWMIIKMDESKGLSFLQRAADHGWAAAQYKLGEACLVGEFLPRDIPKAIAYLQKAADQGGPRSQYTLAQLYANGEGVPRSDADSPVALLRKSAGSGNHLALHALADRYRTGLGVPVDYVRSIRLYQAALEAEAKISSYPQGRDADIFQFLDGNLDPRPGFNGDFINFAKVLSIYLKATEREDAAAMSQLGDWYVAGRFVPKDLVQACRWYNRAAVRGAPDAVEKRDRMKARLSSDQIRQALRSSDEPE